MEPSVPSIDPNFGRLDFRAIAEHYADPLFVALGEHLMWVAEPVEEVLGWSSEDLLATPLSSLAHPDESEALRLLLTRGGPGPVRGVFRLRSRSGAYYWVLVTVSGRLDDHGQVLSMGSLREVDRRVRVERAREELAREAGLWRTLLDQLPDMMALLAPVHDDSGRIVDFTYVFMNTVNLDYLGLTPEDVVGRRVTDLLPDFGGRDLMDHLRTVLETGEPLALDDYRYEDFALLGRDTYMSIRADDMDGLLSLIWRDVTEAHEQRAALAASEERFRLLASNALDVVVHLRDDVIAWVSPSLHDMLGWRPDDWQGRSFGAFVHSDDRSLHEAELDCLEDRGASIHRLRVRAGDGAHHWIEAHAKPYVTGNGNHDGAVVTFRTVDAEVEAEHRLAYLARHDDLTGLVNRREVLERITRMDHHRTPGQRTALLFCDLDHFKGVNDRFGHRIGDDVLRVIASRLRASVRSGDTAARVGGDEFLIILMDVHDEADAVRTAEKIRTAVAAPVSTASGAVQPGVSVGVTLVRSGEPLDDLIARADRAMYEAKLRGRNRIVVFGD